MIKLKQIFLIMFLSVQVIFQESIIAESAQQCQKPFNCIKPYKVQGFFRKLINDSHEIIKEVPTFRTMKIASGFVPFFLIGKRVDPLIHEHFYDATLHKNKHKPPKALTFLLKDPVMAIPFSIYGLYSWCNTDTEKRREAQLFVTGLGLTWLSKVLLKQIKYDAGLRPWHEKHSSVRRAHGGNPSGHASMSTYLATYVWCVKGPWYGVPAALYASLIGSLSVTGNHHYTSQVVAGAGLGVIMGMATYTVLKKVRISENFQVDLATDYKGAIGVQLAYDF
ncbi:MAG: phosphatase PAP2 family protein [Proteobacteria bacterium]|nr:phosphatase PAP2 family protein [Pseudomonadota bacterium]NBP14395.1 phosphatase PAP2 family protein [bacterium]